MDDLSDTFRKAMTALSDDSGFEGRIGKSHVIFPDGHAPSPDEARTSRVFIRACGLHSQLSKDISSAMEAMMAEADDRDAELRKEARELIPEPIRKKMKGILPSEDNRPYMDAYISFIEGVAASPAPGNIMKGQSVDDRLGAMLDFVNDAMKRASDGLTCSINRQDTPALTGTLCEQRGRIFGISAMSYEGFDLFPASFKQSLRDQPVISIIDPSIPEGSFRKPDTEGVKRIFHHAGSEWAGGKRDGDEINRELAQHLIAEFGKDMMKIPENYEVRTKYSTQIMNIIYQAQSEIMKDEGLANRHEKKFDYGEMGQDVLEGIIDRETVKAKDILKLKDGTIAVTFKNSLAYKSLSNPDIQANFRVLENDSEKFRPVRAIPDYDTPAQEQNINRAIDD